MKEYNPLMSRVEELRVQREKLNSKQAEMQKLFVKGHLLRGADLSADHIHNFLRGLGQVCGMNIFNGPHVKTPESYDAETFQRLGNRPPEDINGSVMWDDSGAQIYVFPDKGNWFTLDAYTCKRFDERKALLFTYQELGAREDMTYATSTAEANSNWRKFVLLDGKPLNPEAKYLPTIDQLFDLDPSDPKEAIRAGTILTRVINHAIRKGYGNRVAQSYTTEEIKELQSIHGRFEVVTDYQFIARVLSGRASKISNYPLQGIFNRLARMEAVAAEMQKGKPVMHIGTGWPGTAIGLYTQFDIPVTCIEKDPDFAEKASAGLKRLGLLGRERIQVVCADGANLNPEEYQAVIVSAMVPNEDKEKIIQNLRELTTDSPTQPVLILRTPADKARSLFYQGPGKGILSNPCLTMVGTSDLMIGDADPLRSLVFKIRPMAATRRGEDYILQSARFRLQPVA